MAKEPSSPKKLSIDPKQIGAWLALASTISGLIAGLVKVTGSIYNPIDTVFIFVNLLALMLYAVTGVAALLLGLSTRLFGEDYLKIPVFVIVGILIVVTAIPLGISAATDIVRDNSPMDTLGMTFMRFMGLGIIVLSGWLMYKYAVVPKKQ